MKNKDPVTNKLLLARGPAKDAGTKQYLEVLAIFRTMAAGVGEAHAMLNIGMELVSRCEPSGHEYACVARSVANGFSTRLFTAYIPEDGYPVVGDWAGKENGSLFHSSVSLRRSLGQAKRQLWFISRLREIVAVDAAMTEHAKVCVNKSAQGGAVLCFACGAGRQ